MQKGPTDRQDRDGGQQLLAALKIGVGLAAHSAAVTADGFESAADVFTSGLVLVGMTIAARPADENHPYGHGRVEILTGLLLGFLLFGAGLLIAVHAWTGAGEVPMPPQQGTPFGRC